MVSYRIDQCTSHKCQQQGEEICHSLYCLQTVCFLFAIIHAHERLAAIADTLQDEIDDGKICNSLRAAIGSRESVGDNQ